MTLADYVIEILDEVLFATLILCGNLIFLVCIEDSAVIFMLAQLSDIIGIDAGLLVNSRAALYDSVQIPLRLIVETAVRQDTGDG